MPDRVAETDLIELPSKPFIDKRHTSATVILPTHRHALDEFRLRNLVQD